MAASVFPAIPPTLKNVQPLMKIASEHENRDPVISYWCRLYALQMGLKLDKKSPDSIQFLTSVMDWLEKEKKIRHDIEAITTEVVAQAHIENYAVKLFLWADGEDRAARFNKNVVKTFYTAGLLFDVLTTLGELNEGVEHQRKYAKWKATYIHNCLKNGEPPVPGPVGFESEFGELGAVGGAENYSAFPQPPELPQMPPQPPSSPYDQLFSVPGATGPSNTTPVPPSNLEVPVPGLHAPPSTPTGAAAVTPSNTSISSEASGSAALRPELFHKAQKYCKYAGSALQYEDVNTAIVNLQKALTLLTTGRDD